jgi:hypothetical protein
MAMRVEIVHEGQSWQVEQINKESPKMEGESQKGQESDESQKKEGKSLTKEGESPKKERYIPPQKRERYNSPLELISFSQDSVELNLNNQIGNFANQIRQPKIENMPQMPNLNNFFSDFPTNQSEIENRTLSEKDSEDFSYDLPLLFTLDDFDSFSSPFSNGNSKIEKPTCDFEANKNPLPHEIFDQPESGNFENGLIQSPLGVLKNVVFQNERIKIPADVVVVENEKGVHSNNLLDPIILPTAGALNSPSINQNSVPLVEILQVDNSSSHGKSVATSDTDKARTSHKTNPAWYSKEKYINGIRNYKRRRKKKKFEAKSKRRKKRRNPLRSILF